MSFIKKEDDSTIAAEIFAPDLSDIYTDMYNHLIIRLTHALPINRIGIIRKEIEQLQGDESEDFEKLKYLTALSVLVDLTQQGWILSVNKGKLNLRMENENVDDKEMVRYRLSAERNAQFKSESVKAFIKSLEDGKEYKGEVISIKNLIGDPQALLQGIHNNQKICEPYVQLVTNERDENTGYRLSDIWRYFRYTWSIPYKTMPGRNLFYLVRDRLQPHHPVMGIFALGNSVLNLTVRDDDIGWTVDAIKRKMEKLTQIDFCEQKLGGSCDGAIKVKLSHCLESSEEYRERTENFANVVYPILEKNIADSINDIYSVDLGYYKQTKYPSREQVEALEEIAEEYAKISINNKNNEKSPDWKEEAQTNLFKRKRAAELAKLLKTRIVFNEAEGASYKEKLMYLLAKEEGRRAIHTALIANRKCKIGSNMMDIIVCGAIPPYNDLLAGKLVSLLACSPVVIKDYTERYSKQVSEIASRMKGEKVVRDSRLVYLGTTSLYASGSSQYNRIKAPIGDGGLIEFRKMGITEGYGTVFFSKETTNLFSKLLEIQDGGKKINHVFGEGTSPRFRLISRGLSTIGIKADAFLKHYSPRIVYSINLAKNTNEYLFGIENEVDYGFDIENEADVNQRTQELIDYWYDRWLRTRLTTIDIDDRLNRFDINRLLLGNL